MTTPLEAAIASMDETTRIAIEALHRTHDAQHTVLPPIEIDDDGVMHGDGVVFIPTMRTQRLATPGAEGERHVEAVVWHYTDTRNAGAANLAKRIAPLGEPRSCHVWIDRKGAIAQSASFERGTWHAGGSSAALFRRTAGPIWEQLSKAQRGHVSGVGANSFAAGIELENVGDLRLSGSEWLGWPFRHDYKDADGKIVRPVVVPIDEVDTGRKLHTFTAEQVIAATRVTSALVHRYGLTRDMCRLTHHEIDPTRRSDPGSLWTDVHLPAILAAIFA